MLNKSREKTPMPLLEPKIRATNFSEVSLGYDHEMAVIEAQRCLNCKNAPCVIGCPVNVKIPDFIHYIVENKFKESYLKIKETNSLPSVCGRVCPQEHQCENRCVRKKGGEAVAIGRLERFAADNFANHYEDKTEISKRNGHKVAVIGGGPAGLTCAGDLNKKGYDVTIFEAFHTAGGVLMYGIPEFRLPKTIVDREIRGLVANGVKIETDMVIGKILTIDELFDEMGFEAIFIGSGAGLPAFMNIKGEGLIGVYAANEFLTRINLMKGYKENYDTPLRPAKHVAVVGGGNVAMDAARCAKRLGSDVTVIYRRSLEELPARVEEVHHARQEGIEFQLLSSPVEILGDENGVVKGIKCIKMELGEPDESGRQRPVPIENSEFIIDAESVIMAIGTTPNPLIRKTTEGLDTNKRGCLLIDGNSMTSRKGVFAGGDAVTGAATVILAMGAGKQAAAAIDRYIMDSH